MDKIELDKRNFRLAHHFNNINSRDKKFKIIFLQKDWIKPLKKNSGVLVSELIKEKLIIEAKRETYTTDLSIKEIAFQLGFDDSAYFSRFFKKETSYSSKEYAWMI